VDPLRSPLVDLFRRGEVPRDVKLLAARGAVAPRAHEQLAILILLAADPDAEIAAAAERTLEALPRPALEAFLARGDVAADIKAFFAARGIVGRGAASGDEDGPIVDAHEEDLPEVALGEEAGAGQDDAEGEAAGRRRPLSALTVVERMKLAMRGTREQRSVLIRDPNKLVAAAVLSSPRLTDTEVEAFARMANVSEDVLRTIAGNRQWTRNYAVVAALARNPKTPATISMPLVGRLNERDLKMLSVDRNVPEGLRIAARKLVVTNESRRR
jgi:hypothetical protein